MTKLKSCPFCGGAAKLSTYYDFYRVHCNNDDCIAGLSIGDAYEGHGRWYGNLSEARAAWNTRAERTCHRLQKFGRISKCSDCGYYLIGSEINYCPNCGAKVVKSVENSD